MNAAEYLLRFFNENPDSEDNQLNTSIEAACTAMLQVEQGVKVLKEMGIQRLDTIQSVLPGIWELLWKSFGQTTSDGGLRYFATTKQSIRKLDTAQTMALETLVEKLPENEPCTESEKKGIEALLEAVKTLLAEDSTIANDAKLYIMQLVTDIELNLAEDKISAFDIRNAIERLIGILRILEKRGQGEPESWRKVWESVDGLKDFVIPIAVNIGSAIIQRLLLGN